MTTEIVTTVNTNEIVETTKVETYVKNYRSYFNKSVEGILGMSKAVWDANRLTQADKDEFCKQTGLVEKESTYKKLLKIGTKYQLYINKQNNLPANWTTLYTLTSLTNEAIESAIEIGSIHADMTGLEAKALLPESNKKTKTTVKNNEETDPIENEDIVIVNFKYSGDDMAKVKSLFEKLQKAAIVLGATCEGNKKFRTLFDDEFDFA
jgi:hypothetical protein